MERGLSQGCSPRSSSEMGKEEPLPKLHRPYCMKPLFKLGGHSQGSLKPSTDPSKSLHH